ncbi:unnamed protein product, partial [Discosporangium mesarthrocarpum]
LQGPVRFEDPDEISMPAGVLAGLSDLNEVTRESSCAAIASLFEKVDALGAGRETWAAARKLIAGGLVKKLLPRILDRVPGVKLQATGALRNISAVKDPRVCEVMVSDDCLTPVLTLLERMTTPGREGGGAEGGGGQLNAEQEQTVMSQLVATLCNLLAAVEAAVVRFTNQGGIQVLMRLLTLEGSRGCSEIFGGALQTLHVATDNNPALVEQLVALQGATDGLGALIRGSDGLPNVSRSMRLQAAGILVNMAGASGASSQDQAELGRLVLPLLLESMAYDPASLKAACVKLASFVGGGKGTGAGGEGMGRDGEGEANGVADMEMDGVTDATDAVATAVAGTVTSGAVQDASGGGSEKEVDLGGGAEDGRGGGGAGGHKEIGVNTPDMDAQVRWEWKLGVAEPLKLAAEVITNLCALAAAEEGEGEEDEEEWGSDEEEAMELVATSAGKAAGAVGGENPRILLRAIMDAGAFARVLSTLQALLSPTPRDEPQGQSGAVDTEDTEEGKTGPGHKAALPSGTASDLADLRATVALCMANLVQNLPLGALGDVASLWVKLCSLCNEVVLHAPSCVESVTGIMWGLVRRVGPAVTTAAGAGAGAGAGAPGIDLLLRLCNQQGTPSFEARVNALGMVGVLWSQSWVAGVGTSADPQGRARGSVEGLLLIASALVQSLEDPHVLVQAEAFNAIMDVFGDDDAGRAAAFGSAGGLAALSATVPAFRRKVKLEGAELGRDALCHLKETALNASRFLKYKRAVAHPS